MSLLKFRCSSHEPNAWLSLPKLARGWVCAAALLVGYLPMLAAQQPSGQPQDHSQLPDTPSASKQPRSHSFTRDVGIAAKTIGNDEWHLISAPFRIDSVGFTDKTPFINQTLFWDSMVVGATGVLIANDESVAQQVPYSWHQSGIDISNACTYGTAAAAGGIYLSGLITGDGHAKRTGVLAAEASVDSFLLYGSMKLMFNRDRPYTTPHEGRFFAGNFSGGSFPSGHSALAFTLASVVAHEYPSWPVQLVMYGLATTVATTRVTGGQHFPSDVFVGSTLGYLVGRYVANKDKHPQNQTSHLGIKRVPNAVLSHVTIQ